MATARRELGQAGITLVELTIAAAIAGILSIVMGMVMKSYNKAIKFSDEKFRASGEEMVGARAVWHDVRVAGLSFNTLNNAMDDNNFPFFDYLSDATCSANCSRTLTVSAGNGKSFVMAVSPKNKMAATPLAPGAPPPAGFFDMPPPPLGQPAGTITFVPNRLRDSIKAIDSACAGAGSSNCIWTTGKFLLFYSPFFLRYMPPPPAGGVVTPPNMQVVPRMLSFVGMVNGNVIDRPSAQALADLNVVSQATGFQLRPDFNPADIPNARVDSVEKFFRVLPAIGGTGAFALVAPVEFVRYRVESAKVNGRNAAQLVREVYGAAGWPPSTSTDTSVRRVVAAPVGSLVLTRESISVPSITPNLTMDRTLYREIMKTDPH